MKLTFDQSQCFSVPETLCQMLNDDLAKVSVPDCNTGGIIFNFRDPDYSSSLGGYHPVEARLVKHLSQGKELWQFEYITDFSYKGFPHAELVKEIDVCFRTKRVYNLYGGYLERQDANELIVLFLENFVSYYQMNAFTVTVSFD